MAWALVQSSSCFPWAVSSGSKIRSNQYYSGNYTKRAAISPPIYMMRARTNFSGLGVNNSLCNMVNNHNFHSTTIASSSATSEQASPILPEEDTYEYDYLTWLLKKATKFTAKASLIILPEGVMFTKRAEQVINFAQNNGAVFGRRDGTELILLGLLVSGDNRMPDFDENTDDIPAKVFSSMDINHRDVNPLVYGLVSYPTKENPFTPRLLRVFALALAEAQELGHSYIGSEHLLLGLLRDRGGPANYVLGKLGACPINIRTKVMRMIAAQVVGDGSSGNKIPNLEYGVNLTELAQEKKLHPVVGKQPLINTVIQILGTPSKNIPWLVGQAGVGKTSIVEGLAQRIADSDVPDFLSNKKVITLDKRLVNKERILDKGLIIKKIRFPERLKKLMEEIKECNEMILFIDDVDTLSEWGEEEWTTDTVLNNLIGAVARGELQCVIASKNSKYPEEIKNNPALKRLFQPVKVPGATVDETIKILKGLQERYENHHKVCYTDEALVAAAHLSDQNLSHCCLPGAAIDLIDAAGLLVSQKHEKVSITNPKLQDDFICVREHRLMTREVMGARWRDKDYETSVVWDQEMGDKINMLELEQQRMEEMENNKSEGPTVTIADIEVVLLSWKFCM